jgi:hypothetical protein
MLNFVEIERAYLKLCRQVCNGHAFFFFTGVKICFKTKGLAAQKAIVVNIFFILYWTKKMEMKKRQKCKEKEQYINNCSFLSISCGVLGLTDLCLLRATNTL